jgi:hypothetical protein
MYQCFQDDDFYDDTLTEEDGIGEEDMGEEELGGPYGFADLDDMMENFSPEEVEQKPLMWQVAKYCLLSAGVLAGMFSVKIFKDSKAKFGHYILKFMTLLEEIGIETSAYALLTNEDMKLIDKIAAEDRKRAEEMIPVDKKYSGPKAEIKRWQLRIIPVVAEACRVIAHAKWRKKRGKNPSKAYREEMNPRKALAMAYADLEKFDALCGMRLGPVLVNLVDAARLTQKNIRMDNYNGVNILITPRSTAEEILAYFYRKRRKVRR